MMGLEVIGKDLEPECVFRLGRFKDVTGIARGQVLTPANLAKIFHSSKGLFKGTPVLARRIAFLNKLDLLPDGQGARELADFLLCPPETLVDRVVIGSIRDKKYFFMSRKT
jgi:probable selenium-dependent hydroxylase accessory protein YqeC